MSLKRILEEIQSRAETEILDIEKNSQNQANQILEQAREEAKEIQREACEEIAAPAGEERARIINRAQLEALGILDEARKAAIEESLERVRERLAEMRAEEAYPAALRAMFEEAIGELKVTADEDENLRLMADERDKSLLKDILNGSGQKIEVNFDLDTWGGLVAGSADGRVMVYNTLESRLEDAMAYIRRYLATRFS